MHPSAWEFLVGALAPYVGTNGRVVEFGAQDLGQGSPRCLFPFAEYTAVDLVAGPGVDVVTDAADWEPEDFYRVAISAEVFEHAERWREIVATARKALMRGGVFVVTCAVPPRRSHSAVGNETVPDGEYYQNVRISELKDVMASAGFDARFEYGFGDVYAVGTAV